MGKRVTTYERIMQDRIIQGLLDDIRNEVPPEVALRGNAKTNPHRARVAEFFKALGNVVVHYSPKRTTCTSAPHL
jgi:hypothetical protein